MSARVTCLPNCAQCSVIRFLNPTGETGVENFRNVGPQEARGQEHNSTIVQRTLPGTIGHRKLGADNCDAKSVSDRFCWHVLTRLQPRRCALGLSLVLEPEETFGRKKDGRQKRRRKKRHRGYAEKQLAAGFYEEAVKTLEKRVRVKWRSCRKLMYADVTYVIL